MFRLSELLGYDDIVIQCHDSPDADTLASAFAIHTYLEAGGVKSRIVYSGNAKITKPNLVKMVELISIPISHVSELDDVKTIVTVDCQYGETNVTKFDADTVYVIDHHDTKTNSHKGTVCSYLGSCSTIIWDLLIKEKFDLDNNLKLSTALYYGLYTDTSCMEEISHPLDKDMRDSLKFDSQIINSLRFNNLTIDELNIAGTALTRYNINERLRCAVFRADACDQNILGFIGDLALQVEGADICIVYNTLASGYKISIRSCTREVMANEFASFLVSGGGHKQKAGGFVSKAEAESSGLTIDELIKSRMQEYFDSYDIIYANNNNLNVADMIRYKKLKTPVRYVKSSDVFAEGTPMLIRTLEGDVEAVASDNTYLMIGVLGEVYPITEDKFKLSYTPISAAQSVESGFSFSYSYSPTVKNKITGEATELITYSKACVANGDVFIYATETKRNIKVFTLWNTDSYMYGVPGDYIAVREDDVNDVYVVRGDVFLKTYEKV
jgi:phosphoglycolate phosphatase